MLGSIVMSLSLLALVTTSSARLIRRENPSVYFERLPDAYLERSTVKILLSYEGNGASIKIDTYVDFLKELREVCIKRSFQHRLTAVESLRNRLILTDVLRADTESYINHGTKSIHSLTLTQFKSFSRLIRNKNTHINKVLTDETNYYLISHPRLPRTDIMTEYARSWFSIPINDTLKQAESKNGHSMVLKSLQHLEVMMRRYETILREFQSIVKDLEAGELTHDMLSPDTLSGMLQAIKFWNQDLMVPLSQTDATTHDLLSISFVGVGLINDNLIIEIEVPLVRATAIQLYRMHPLPVVKFLQSNETVTQYFLPTHEYLAIDKHGNKFGFPSNTDFNECRETNYSLICTELPVWMDIARMKSCELSIFITNVTNPIACTIRSIKGEYQYIQYAHYERAWIYSFSRDIETRRACEDEPEVLNGMGRFVARSHCEITFGNSSLREIYSNSSFIGTLQLVNWTNPEIITRKITTTTPTTVKKINHTVTSTITPDIGSIAKSLGMFLVYTLVPIAGIGIMVWCACAINNHRRARNADIPTDSVEMHIYSRPYELHVYSQPYE